MNLRPIASTTALATLVLTLTLISCHNGNHDTANYPLVINEIMASNATGLQDEDGDRSDWIEIKNTGNEDVDLKKVVLLATKENKNDSLETTEWTIPDTTLHAGKCLLVFASKKDRGGEGKQLHASFKLPSKKGEIALLSDKGDTITHLSYNKLDDDESYRLTGGGSYEKSHMPTPGLDNTEEGFEAYNKLLEQQCTSPIKVWRVSTKGDDAWVEVKNVSQETVQLSGYTLGSKLKGGNEVELKATQLAAGSTTKIFCAQAGLDISDSESVLLLKDGKVVDGTCGKPAPYGTAVGRVEGKDGFFFLPLDEKGKTGRHFRFIAAKPSFSKAPGVYDNLSKLKLTLDTHGYKTHFTTNGSAPTMASATYSDSIALDTTCVVRAFSEGDSTHMASPIATATYFLGEKHTLPVINISVNPNDLWDHNNGIYVEGPGASPVKPHMGANYWKKWWKKAHIEFYDGDKGFEADCGLAIFGGFSRALAKKSFKIKFKDIYGPKNVKYDIYDEGEAIKLKTMVLRSGSQDMHGVMARDEFFTSLMVPNSPTLIVQNYRPVVLYINAQYFGVYYVRDKIDKHFAARKLHADKDSVKIIMMEKSNPSYAQVIAYEKSHDITKKETYDYVSSRIDINSLIDWKLAQIYASKTDVGNSRFMRSEQKGGDNKWYCVHYDIDYSWSDYKPAAKYLRPSSYPLSNAHNNLTNDLLKNAEFRKTFIERLSMHLHKTFSPQNANAAFDKIINAIRPEMERNCKRWPQFGSYSTWEKNVKNFKSKFDGRPALMLNDLRRELKITPEEDKKYFSDLGY